MLLFGGAPCQGFSTILANGSTIPNSLVVSISCGLWLSRRRRTLYSRTSED